MHTPNFMAMPVRKPIKAPNAALNMSGAGVWLINSPAKAPNSGMIIMPKGGKTNSPAMVPKKQPMEPALLPPNFLVLKPGLR